MKVIKITKNEELFNKVLSYEVKWAEATSNKMANKALEAFASIKGNDLVKTMVAEMMEWGIGWFVDGEMVLLTVPTTSDERHFYATNDAKVVDSIHRRKMELAKKLRKNAETKVEKKMNNTVNVDDLMASINKLRTRNSELVSNVGKMKSEIKSANDEIASLKNLLEMATLKIAELEDANEELSIYKEMVEEETKIEE